MSTTQPHSCETNNCNGSRYYGWSLNCRFCGKKIFVECLRQLDELRTKELLHAFELMSKTVRSDGTFEWKILSDKPSKYSEFLQMFSADSIFGITCHCCATKFNKITTEMEHREVSIQRLSEEIVKSVNKSIQNKLNNGLIDLGASSSASHSDNKNTNPKKTPGPQKITPINGIYSIHVSRLPKDATSDDVTAIIIANSEIHTDAFSVEKIPNKRFKVKKQSDGTAQKKNKQNAEKKRTTQHNSDNNNNRLQQMHHHPSQIPMQMPQHLPPQMPISADTEKYQRVKKKGWGGVLIAVEKSLQPQCIGTAEHLGAEQVWAKVKYNGRNLILIQLYIRPDSPFEVYKANMNALREVASKANQNDVLLVSGDFNLRNLIWYTCNNNADYDPDDIFQHNPNVAVAINA
ncbi:uncharacterized protein LOC129571002, partial [Sitodiplosis mosellana]|uniref:uncharacterized protein LOC129571002 n=1 Tax=Sitodiplosis mosellana TaxID=263140 RepID=UPI002444F550